MNYSEKLTNIVKMGISMYLRKILLKSIQILTEELLKERENYSLLNAEKYQELKIKYK